MKGYFYFSIGKKSLSITFLFDFLSELFILMVLNFCKVLDRLYSDSLVSVIFGTSILGSYYEDKCKNRY